MAHRQKKSIIGYFFGLPGETGRILRQNAVMIGSITIIFFLFLVHLMLTRLPFDMTILPNYNFSPRVTDDGRAINSYVLSIRNMGRSDLELGIKGKTINRIIEIIPDRILLEAGSIKKIPVYVVIKGFDRKETIKTIDISIESKELNGIKVTKKANFAIPGV